MSPSRSSAHIRDDDDTAALQSAKQTFVTAIQQGMDALMIHCGFSRERAVAILMRELQRVDRKEDDKVKLLRPTDQEVSSNLTRFEDWDFF
jgi:glutaredoxin-related protein